MLYSVFQALPTITTVRKKINLSYVVIAHTVFVIIALTVRYMPLKNALVYSYLLFITHDTVLFVFSTLMHNVLVYVLVSLPVIYL